MYDTQEIARRIKRQAKMKSVNLKDMLDACDLGINAISQFAKGAEMSCITLAQIADFLDCSVDYLLGRSDTP